MATREEIREGIIEILKDGVAHDTPYGETADALRSYLHSQRCRIEVDRELPEKILDVLFYQRLHGRERMEKLEQLLESEAGYHVTEPLVEE